MPAPQIYPLTSGFIIATPDDDVPNCVSAKPKKQGLGQVFGLPENVAGFTKVYRTYQAALRAVRPMQRAYLEERFPKAAIFRGWSDLEPGARQYGWWVVNPPNERIYLGSTLDDAVRLGLVFGDNHNTHKRRTQNGPHRHSDPKP